MIRKNKTKTKIKKSRDKNPLSDDSDWISSYDDIVGKKAFVIHPNGFIEGILKRQPNKFNKSRFIFAIDQKLAYFIFNPEDISKLKNSKSSVYISINNLTGVPGYQ